MEWLGILAMHDRFCAINKSIVSNYCVLLDRE